MLKCIILCNRSKIELYFVLVLNKKKVYNSTCGLFKFNICRYFTQQVKDGKDKIYLHTPQILQDDMGQNIFKGERANITLKFSLL